MKFVKRQLKETEDLLIKIPGWVTMMFVVAVVCMNLFANKSISMPFNWLALDCGIIFSWACFMSMDLVTKQFGASASVKLTVFSIFVSLVISFLFFVCAKIPGIWGAEYDLSNSIATVALDMTVKGNWFIVFGSTIAFLVSSVVNSFLNEFIGTKMKKDNFGTFAVRAYVSTMIGQFVDNMTFALIVSTSLFGWTWYQCLTCSLTGAVCELIFEVVFSPLGWKVCKRWNELDRKGVAA